MGSSGIIGFEGTGHEITRMPRATGSVSTYGLTHLVLGVTDPAHAFEFYRRVFGMVAVYEQADFIQAQTPGARDVLVFERSTDVSAKSGSIAHFGFRLIDAADIDDAVAAVRDAGGTIVEQGEFVPGEPYVFARDVDGYLLEIWYELPTRADPRSDRPGTRATSRKRRRDDG